MILALYFLMVSIFTRIIKKEILGHFVYEDDVCVAIMDAFPCIPGQTLVIPKVEVDYIFKLNEQTYDHLWKIAKRIAMALDNTFDTERTCVVVEGFEVPHVHIKLYPMPYKHPPLGSIISQGKKASDAELEEMALRVKSALQTIS